MEYHWFKADVWKTVLFPYILWEKLVDYAYIFYNVYNKMEGSKEWQNSFRLKKNMWLKEEGFKDLLKTWWMDYRFRAFFSYIPASKIQSLEDGLKSLE